MGLGLEVRHLRVGYDRADVLGQINRLLTSQASRRGAADQVGGAANLLLGSGGRSLPDSGGTPQR